MDGLGGIVWLIILWVVINMISGAKKRQQQAKRRQAPSPEGAPRAATPRLQQEKARRLDPSQEEARRLERLLRSTGRGLEGGKAERGPMGRTARRRLESAEEVEERETLEQVPEPVSLETDFRWAEREIVDQDAGAEALVARRIQEAEARNRALTLKDHLAFDQRIRQPEDHTAAPSPRAALLREVSLKEAIVLREILGPPVSLRGRDPGGG